MKNFILSFIFIVFTCQALFSQGLEGKQVTLRANTSVNGNEFFIKITCYKDSVKIEFKSKDSVSLNKLKNDRVYKKLMRSFREIKRFDFTNDTLQNLIYRLDSVTVVHTIYHTDSVLITYSQFPEYSELLSNLFKSSKVELENSENIKGRITLDGTNMKFLFSQNELIQFSAMAHSPNENSHPLLYNYVKSTLDIYRRIKTNTFLTIKKTSGY